MYLLRLWNFRHLGMIKIPPTGKEICSEEGSVESALVVIPLMVLFLISMQLVIAISSRNSEMAFVESEATNSAISQVRTADTQIINLGDSPSLPDLALVITHRRREIATLVPFNFLPERGDSSHRESDVTGLAIVEPRNS
jgi:hypothetical protein